MFRRNKLSLLNAKDDRIKIINERIASTEKHLIGLCNIFAAGTRKMARSRDIMDELAKSFKGYADDEDMNESLTDGLKNFTNALTILGDYMDHNVHRMEAKVVNELAQIEGLCKTTRDNLRAAVIARDKEVLKQRQLMDIKSKFSANNMAADSDLMKAKLEVTKANKQIDEVINNFEKRKLASVKEVLQNFVLIALKYHTKSIEALTASYYDISNIDEKSDFQEFQKTMKTKEEAHSKKSSARKAALLVKSQSMDHLEGASEEGLLNPLKKRNRLSRSQKSLTRKDSDDEPEDMDEEDDDEEEEEFDENSEEDSGSASDDDDSEDEEVDEVKPQKETKRRIEVKKSKLQREPIKTKLQPFKATNAMKPTSRISKPLNKPFAAQRFVDDSGDAQAKSSSLKPQLSSRLVTVVEAKSSGTSKMTQ